MKRIEKALEYITVVILAFLVIIVTLQIAARIFSISIMWTEELARYTLVYLTFLGAALAFYKGEGLRITILIDKFSLKIRKINDSLILLLTLCATIFVAYVSISLIQSLWDSPTAALRWSKGLITIILPVGFSLVALRIVKDVKTLFKT